MITLLLKNQGIKVSEAVKLKFHIFQVSVSESGLWSLLCIKGKRKSENHQLGDRVSPVKYIACQLKVKFQIAFPRNGRVFGVKYISVPSAVIKLETLEN